MADRRRINGPLSTTHPPVFGKVCPQDLAQRGEASRTRGIFLKTGVTPSASGSAYLEVGPGHGNDERLSGLKIVCTVHGPRALPRSAPFSPHLLLATHVKFAPFATARRRGYLRDSSERDLSIHLETALRAAVIADRWPKSGVDVIVTIIEAEHERGLNLNRRNNTLDAMNVLGACITVASAAIIDAGIDCIDSMTGGVAALAPGSDQGILLDQTITQAAAVPAAASACLAYLPSRGELAAIWMKGKCLSSPPFAHDQLAGAAIQTAKGVGELLVGSLSETAAVGGA